MEDDLDTPITVKVMVDLAGDILRSADQGMNVEGAHKTLKDMSRVIGLRLGGSPEDRVVEGWREQLQRFL